MISWRPYIPAFSLVLGGAAFAAAWLGRAGDDAPATTASLAAGDPATSISVRPVVVDQRARRTSPRTPRPTGLLELNIGRPEDILMTEQRHALLDHLKRVRLTMAVPDAMSFASTKKNGAWVLSAASAPNAGFFLFSEKPGRKVSAANARKFLRDFFKDALTLSFAERDEKFLSRGAGEMTWVRGQSSGGQRFDAFVIGPNRAGFTHLLFIYDPTVANASRRLMVDSVRAVGA